MKKLAIAFTLGCASLSFVACTAKIYMTDRHTILEDEAAGEWPQFEKELTDKGAEKGPTPFPKTGTSAAKKRLYNVLNGEATGPQTTAALKAKETAP